MFAPWYSAVQIPVVCHAGRLPGPLPRYSLHSWEQSFETACSMVLMINFFLCVTLCSMNRPLGFYFPPCHTCILPAQFNDFTISSEILSPGPRLPRSPWQEGSGSRANHGSWIKQVACEVWGSSFTQRRKDGGSNIVVWLTIMASTQTD